MMHENEVQTLIVDLDSLTTDQCKQVFANGHVRDLGEQRAYLESKFESERMTKVAQIEDGTGYVLKGANVIFKKGVSMNKNDLIAILGRLK